MAWYLAQSSLIVALYSTMILICNHHLMFYLLAAFSGYTILKFAKRVGVKPGPKIKKRLHPINTLLSFNQWFDYHRAISLYT